MIINLLSNPRNVSTALMYAFAQRPDTLVLDEPFYASFLSRTQKSHPGKEDILASQPQDYNAVVAQILTTQENPPHKNTFIKNMAHHLDQQDWSWMQNAFNVLFIRHPAEVLHSFAKVIPQPSLDDIAIGIQVRLLRFFQENGIPFLVLDARDLLQDPEYVLNKICDHINVDHDQRMLTWSPGPKPYDGVWASHWYKNVHQSTGFIKSNGSSPPQLPTNLNEVLKKAMPMYLELYQQRMG